MATNTDNNLGRPPLYDEPTAIVSFRIPKSWKNAFAKLTDNRKMVPELMRSAFREFLEKKKAIRR